MKAVAIRTASTAQSTLTTFSTTSTTVSVRDASKIHYGVIRWYEPVTGRWLSNDPIGISGGLNQYVFCANNPVNGRDPFGLYDSAREAAEAALRLAYPLARQGEEEYGGWIYRKKVDGRDQWFFTPPTPLGPSGGTLSWAENKPNEYDDICGTYHVHWDKRLLRDEDFSGGDNRGQSDLMKQIGHHLTFWLGTPQGAIREYRPGPKGDYLFVRERGENEVIQPPGYLKP